VVRPTQDRENEEEYTTPDPVGFGDVEEGREDIVEENFGVRMPVDVQIYR
jgi:hypothetical protein